MIDSDTRAYMVAQKADLKARRYVAREKLEQAETVEEMEEWFQILDVIAYKLECLENRMKGWSWTGPREAELRTRIDIAGREVRYGNQYRNQYAE